MSVTTRSKTNNHYPQLIEQKGLHRRGGGGSSWQSKRVKADHILGVTKDESGEYGTSDQCFPVFSLTNGPHEVRPLLRTASGHLLGANIYSFDELDKIPATGYTPSMAITSNISDRDHAREVLRLSFFRACKLLCCSQSCLSAD